MKVSSNRSLLITRPLKDGIAFSNHIHAENSSIKTVCSPLFEIENMVVKKDLSKVNALIITSSNAVRSLIQSEIKFTGPLLCVGDATASLAQRAGYHSVSSNGNSNDLVKLIESLVPEGMRNLVYFRGEQISRDLVASLREENCNVDEVISYRKRPIGLSKKIINDIANGSILGASFFSKQTVELFFNYVERIPKGFIAFCISSEVSSTLLSIYPQSLISVRVAKEPTVDEMCKLVVAAPEFAA